MKWYQAPKALKASNYPTPQLGDPALASLFAMLSYRRPEGSRSERKFIDRFLAPLDMQRDGAGNYYKRIGDARVLWSAHTDSVHRNGGFQRIHYIGGVVDTRDKESNCLGADNAAGVWMLREMILAKRPGLYVFHRGEEHGGKGSNYIVNNLPAPGFLDGIQAAIAFDRRNTESIITHQWAGRCCSDAFADSLSEGLGLGHRKDPTGSFTDTANYIDLVGECSNVSVGFAHEHTAYEALDVPYLFALRDRVLALDESKLVFARKPGEVEESKASKWDNYLYGYSHRDFERNATETPANGAANATTRRYKPNVIELPDHTSQDYEGPSRRRVLMPGWDHVEADEDADADAYKAAALADAGDTDAGPEHYTPPTTLLGIVHEFPDDVADFLDDYGVDVAELLEYIAEQRAADRAGVVRHPGHA